MSSIRRTSTRPMSALSTFWDASPTMMTEVMPSGIFSIASGRSALGSINNAPSNPYMYGFDGALLIEPSALRPEAIEKMPEGITSVIIVGDASQKVESALIGRVDVRRIEDIEVPDAKVVANFGLNLLGTPELATPTPFYLRPPDASIPKQK